MVREPAAQRLGVAARGELCGNEQRDDPAGTRKLEGTLGERDREIGEVREPTLAGWTPGRVPPPERLPHLRGQALAAHPRRIPEY